MTHEKANMKMSEINKEMKRIESIMVEIPTEEEEQTKGEKKTLRLHKALIVRKFFMENPHEIQNEVYGDGISHYGDLALEIQGIHINHHNEKKAKENRDIVAEVAEKEGKEEMDIYKKQARWAEEGWLKILADHEEKMRRRKSETEEDKYERNGE